MAEQLLTETPISNPNLVSEFDELFNFDNGDLDGVNFDDIELTFDNMGDLYFPDENEHFLLPEPDHAVDHAVNSGAFRSGYQETGAIEAEVESGSSEVPGDRDGSDVGKFLNWGSSESGSYGENDGSPEIMGGTVSSRGSGVSETVNAGSPSSEDCCDRGVVEQKVKVEEFGGRGLSKRKKEEGEEGLSMRTSKFRRAGGSGEDGNVESNSGGGGGGSSDVEEKRKARLLRNRESAQMSRQRKKQHVEELEDKVRSMHSTIADLNNRISYVLAENASLRQQLSGNGACPQPPPGMYPQPQMGPMCYPWMPYSPYVVKPQGSQVPLVPIPRLKPQHSVSASKGKKSEGKKSSEGRTKKVASITFVGLLFFILLLGGMVPMINLRFGGLTDNVSSVGREFYEQHRGRILDVDGHSNGSGLSVSVRYSNEKCDINNRIHHSGGTGNCDEQYAISLQVPRDNKVVKIDGNLIYHSVRASEEAVASQVKSEANKREETSLAVRSDLAAALAIPEFKKNRGKNPHMYRNPTERQRALSSGSVDSLKDQPKSSVDGRLQQWFSEGLAGPILSSGMCTEVFQFDVSPTSSPGAIVPASAISNVSAERRQNATHHYKGRNRRILQGIPVSLPGSTVNNTEEQVKRASPKDGFQGNKSGSSMVVSVLVDPREVGDGSGDSSMVGPKSLSRIFVVVLLDSVKYVTYSCMLPGVAPHLVAA